MNTHSRKAAAAAAENKNARIAEDMPIPWHAPRGNDGRQRAKWETRAEILFSFVYFRAHGEIALPPFAVSEYIRPERNLF